MRRTYVTHSRDELRQQQAAPASTSVLSGLQETLRGSIAQIESSFIQGFAGLQLIGNTSEVCKDGKERAKAALEHLGIMIPPKRLVVSIAPADVKKDGNHFDLPIAVSLALLLEQRTPMIDLDEWMFTAELGLSGELRPVRGIVAFTLAAAEAGLTGIVVARQNIREATTLARFVAKASKPLRVLAFDQLDEVLDWTFSGICPAKSMVNDEGTDGLGRNPALRYPNFDDMLLSDEMAAAALVCAAGMHSMLLRGVPGTGKSMFAARLPSIMPLMEQREHIDCMKTYSAHTSQLPPAIIAGIPPFRSPHHQASAPAVVGSVDGPGELALAHGGVLFLDEMPEFRRDIIESLREPLETHEIRVSRSKFKGVWQARVLLVAACNACPCGWFGSSKRMCQCSANKLLAYQQKLSGPILDRIDLHVTLPDKAHSSAELFLRMSHIVGDGRTQSMRETVEAARAFAFARNRAFGVSYNSELSAQLLPKVSGVDSDTFTQMVMHYADRQASSRSLIRSMRVARTLADLALSPCIRADDIETAMAWQKPSQDYGSLRIPTVAQKIGLGVPSDGARGPQAAVLQ